MRLLRRRKSRDDARLWRRDIHRFILMDRQISIAEVAHEMGIPYDQARRYFTEGGSEALADAVDGAIDAICDRSDRRDMVPPRILGTSAERIIPDLVMRDLMKAPGRDV